jgi:adenylate cyclase
MGIGINTGEVVVGNIGSVRRAKYGIVGSHVNLTARIESYTVGGQILISDGTLNEVESSVSIGKQMKLTAKGFSDPINIYEVDGITGAYNIQLPSHVDSLTLLPKPITVVFSLLDGKHMTGPVQEGEVLSLSPFMALIRPSAPLPVLSNIRLEFPIQPILDTGDTGDLYAKSVEEQYDDGTVKIRFTAVPEEVADAIRNLCGKNES